MKNMKSGISNAVAAGLSVALLVVGILIGAFAISPLTVTPGTVTVVRTTTMPGATVTVGGATVTVAGPTVTVARTTTVTAGTPGLGVDVIKIGALEPLTGPFALWGKQHLEGAKMAVDEINAKGGVLGAKLELVVIDDKNDAKEASTAFRKMIEVDKVVAVMGTVSSGIGAALSPLAEELKTPLLFHMSGSHTLLKLSSRYIFRTCLPAAPMNYELLGEFVQQQGLKTVAAVIASYEWGFAVRDALQKSIGNLAGVRLEIVEAPVGERDFTTHLRKIQPLSPDIIVIGHPPGSGAIVSQALDLGIRPKYFLGTWNPIASWLGVLGEKRFVEAGILEYTCIDYESPEWREVAARFNKRTGLFFDHDAATGYLNVYMIANAIEKMRSVDPVKIAEYFRTGYFHHPILAWPLTYTEWGEFKGSRITLWAPVPGNPGETNPGAGWIPKIVFRSSPAIPYRPPS
jgi:branched-chain amino acid transport system substrate-binding protein